MRKFKIITGLTLIALVVGAVVLHSCNKQELAEKALSGQATQQPQMTVEDAALYSSIINFRQKLSYQNEHPDFKSGELMSVDSAKWYLDASFNLTYAFTAESFTSFNADTFTIFIGKTGNMLNLDDVSTAFFEMKERTLNIYNATMAEEKELYVSYMEVVNNTVDEVELKVTATIGGRNNSTPPDIGIWGPFEEGDDWMYGELLGDCTTGGGIWWKFKDAATEIWNATNTYAVSTYRTKAPDGMPTTPSQVR